ncbi:hypothetical protein LTR15_000028 [Elasticomyces elasticus]|nr:hypothetical protein LTR15_000028 [Elasticomyces elasticus]
MASDDKHFRLLDLPPELRVHIYECFFEPSLHSSARIDIFDVETIKRHAPDLAILATNHLVRREAYEIGVKVERDYYQNRCFTLEVLVPWNLSRTDVPDVECFTPDLRKMTSTIASLPLFPVRRLELCTPVTEEGVRTMWFRAVFSVTSEGKVELVADVGDGSTTGLGSHGRPITRSSFADSATAVKKLGISVTRGKMLISLDVKNFDKPFRLLDLPPELRVRIYECFFESEGPQTVELFETTKYAPSQAITAVSKLVRHETYQIGKEAERAFFQRSFFIEFSIYDYPIDNIKAYFPGLEYKMRLVASLPCFPITCLEVQVTQKEPSQPKEWSRMVVTPEPGGGITETHDHEEGVDIKDLSHELEKTTKLQNSLSGYSNVVEAVLYWHGWAKQKNSRFV